MPLRSPPAVLLLLAVLLAAQPARAQSQRTPSVRLDVADAPLAEALAALRAQTGADVVFARSLVAGRRVTCRYTGDDVAQALACLLGSSDLRAERVRRRQYVVVRAEGNAGPGGKQAGRATLSGFVTDAATGETLPGAHVSLSALRLGTPTNSAGFFSLAGLPTRRYRVHASYVGYRALDTVVAVRAGAPPLDLALRPRALEAEEVVVRSREDTGGGRRAPGEAGVEALSAQALAALPSFLGEGDLIQALEAFPGVRKSGAVGGGMSVRGGQADQNLYLLDGAPVYHPWHAFSLLSTFQTGTLQNVRLHKGAFPAAHGGRLSSVLDAQMKDGRRRGEPHVTLGLSPLSGRFLVETPLSERLSLMVSGRRSYLDLLLGKRHPVEGEGGRRDTLRTGYFFYDTSAKLAARLSEKHRLSVSYYHGRDNLDLRLPFDLSLDFSSWLRPADLFFEIGQNWENELASARHRWLASDRLFLTSTAYVSNYSAREGAFIRPSTSASVASDYRVRLRDAGLKLDADYALAPAHQVRAGFQATHRRFESQLATDLRRAAGLANAEEDTQQSRQRAAEVAAFVQDTWQPTPRLAVRPGLRASFFSSGSYVRFSPRLSASYQAHPRLLTVRAAAGRYAQYLHRLRDRYSLVYDLVSSRWVPVTAQVEPARATQLSIGADSRPLPALSLRADAYWRRATGVPTPADPYRRKDQLEGLGLGVGALLGQYTGATTHAYGLEVEARWQPAGPWRARLSYAAARSTLSPELGPDDDSEAGRATPRSYPDRRDVPHIFQADARYVGARWSASLSATARSGYPTTVPVARYRLSDPLSGSDPTAYLHRPQPGNGRLPPYLRLDASVGRRFAWLGARWHAQLHLYNATARRSTIGRTYELTPEDRVRTDDRRGLPLLPLFEVEVEL